MATSISPSSDEPFPSGSMLGGRYRIEAVLGTGGMGRVYRAEHTGAGTQVAIKVLHADLTRNREASQRFKREMMASSRLAHPNIVRFTETGELDDGACYLVMEMLQGESLGDRLARDHRIPWRQAIDILRGVLHGLDHAHQCNVVHRDIKPDNVYLADQGGEPVIKLLDFGIAKFLAGDPDDPAMTRAGLTVGTPAYLSPEQAVGGTITEASDLYSASVVLYEMLAGRAPFEDKEPLAMLGAHVSRPPPPFAEVAPGVEIPPELEDIVQHGLRKAPADRIGTAAGYLSRLDEHWPAGPRSPTARAASTPAAGIPRRAQTSPAGTPLSARSGRAVSVEMAQLPRAVRAVSLAEVGEQIPLTWIVRSAALIGLLIIAAIALAIGAHCRGSGSTAPPAASAGTGSGSEAGAGSTAPLGAVSNPAPNAGSSAAPNAAPNAGSNAASNAGSTGGSSAGAGAGAKSSGGSAPLRPDPAAEPSGSPPEPPPAKPAAPPRPGSGKSGSKRGTPRSR